MFSYARVHVFVPSCRWDGIGSETVYCFIILFYFILFYFLMFCLILFINYKFRVFVYAYHPPIVVFVFVVVVVTVLAPG